MMPRVFVDATLRSGQSVTVAGDDGHHFARVLRAKIGEPMVVAGQGHAFLGEIAHVDAQAGQVTLTLGESLPPHEPTTRILLLQALAKGDKVEEILQKCTEAGVTDFVVMATDRSVVQLDDRKATARLMRWQRLVREAAAQSQRDRVPTVAYTRSQAETEERVRWFQADCVLLLDELETQRGIQIFLQAKLRSDVAGPDWAPRSIAVAVGPEGGWTDAERAWMASALEATSITLGPRIFRTETAGLAAVCAILSQAGDMGGR